MKTKEDSEAEAIDFVLGLMGVSNPHNVGNCTECGEEGPRLDNDLGTENCGCGYCNECGKVERQPDGPLVCEDCYAYLLSIAK